MRLITMLLCLAAAALAQEAPGSRGQDARDTQPAASRPFASSCVSCHLPPDPAFPVERAWITQLADTA